MKGTLNVMVSVALLEYAMLFQPTYVPTFRSDGKYITPNFQVPLNSSIISLVV
jgi:hypothetical protein